jgi:hypothetical protein
MIPIVKCGTYPDTNFDTNFGDTNFGLGVKGKGP